MIHNGIEYGLMQAYAEGFDILRTAANPSVPAEQRFDLDLARHRRALAARQRRHLVAARPHRVGARRESAPSTSSKGSVEDSGEGRWTIETAIDEAVPADVLSAALYARFRSRQKHTFAEKMLSAMRFGFGGHVETGQSGPTAKGKS